MAVHKRGADGGPRCSHIALAQPKHSLFIAAHSAGGLEANVCCVVAARFRSDGPVAGRTMSSSRIAFEDGAVPLLGCQSARAHIHIPPLGVVGSRAGRAAFGSLCRPRRRHVPRGRAGLAPAKSRSGGGSAVRWGARRATCRGIEPVPPRPSCLSVSHRHVVPV